MIAALDTSGPRAAFAVADPSGQEVLVNLQELPVGRESAGLLPRLLTGLQAAGLALDQIRAWHVGMGPGSFTGVRIGAALVQGICAGTGAICHGLPTSLAIVRQAAGGQLGNVAVLNDARRDEAILSLYRQEDDDWVPAAPPRILAVADVPDLAVDLFLLADSSLADRLPTHLPQLVVPAADARFLLADSTVADPELQPVYVRPPVFVPPIIPGK